MHGLAPAIADSIVDTEATIESLDLEGQGVAHVGGKTIFISGALTGERVRFDSFRKKSSFERARVGEVLVPSAMRVSPRCPHFGVCGGCALQHLDAGAQVAAKQRALEDVLLHLGRVRADTMLSPIHGPYWGYRYRARLAVRDVHKKGGVLVGFHERGSSFVADIRECHTLPARISRLLVPLRSLIESLDIRARVPQIEVACGDEVDVLVLRHLAPVGDADAARLRGFADRHSIQWWLQAAGPDSARPFHPAVAPALSYRLPEFGVTLRFLPTDFTQVNVPVNRMLVRRTLRLLDPQPGERIGDFFSGLGNFSLPLASRGARVIGLEGSAALVARARQNAKANGIAAEFMEADLFRFSEGVFRVLGPFHKLLIDPPRDGAIEVVKAVSAPYPARIVYVSCNPATLARDAEVLVHVKGYRLAAAGVANMFPHTGHVESITLFTRTPG